MTLEIYNAANGIPFGTATIGGEGGKNYDKEIQELQDKVKEIELFKFPNATIVGEPSIDHGQIANFSTENYLMFPFELDVRDKAFEVYFPFTTGEDVTTQQNILDSRFGIALAIKDGLGLMAVSYDGQGWGSLVSGVMEIQPNTTYYAKLSWNKLQYKTLLSKNEKDYVEDMSFTSATGPFPATIFIGGGSAEALGHTPTPFKGTINLNKAYVYINGQLIWQGMDDAGLATRLDVDLTNIAQPGIEAIQNIVGNPYTKTEIDEQMEDKQDKLIAGPNITIDPDTNVISAEGGEVDAYTKAETDGLLEKKQDVLTPNDPLKIETYVKSNMVGMKYTEDLTGVLRNPANTGVCNSMHSGNSDKSILFTVNTSASATGYTLEQVYNSTGYIDIPYTLDQTLNVGKISSSASSRIPNCTLGKFVDGRYIPILSFRYYVYYGDTADMYFRINHSDEPFTTQVYSSSTTYIKTTTAQKEIGAASSSITGTLGTLIQLRKYDSGYVGVNIYYGGKSWSIYGSNYTTADYERLKEITTCRIAPTNEQGYTSAIPVTNIGLYNTTTSITGNETSTEEWGPNQFDLSGVTTYNYLDLKTDSSLTVTPEGNLSVNTDAMAFGSELDYDGTNLSLLSSDGGTLSAVEINLDDKQDVLTPNDPLSIKSYIKSPIEGMTIGDDGIIRPDDGQYITLTSLPFSNSGTIGFPSTGSATTGYIDIPYTFGDIVKVPMPEMFYQSGSMYGWKGSAYAFMGKIASSGEFIPIIALSSISQYYFSGNYQYYNYSMYGSDTGNYSAVTYAPSSYICTYRSNTSYWFNSSIKPGTYSGYYQLTGNDSGVNLKGVCVTTQASTPAQVREYGLDMTFTNTDAIARAKEITTVRIFPAQYSGVYRINSSAIGKYNNGLSLSSTTASNIGENKFDLTALVAYNYLDLKVDNTTIKVNAEGNLEAQYPAELNGVKLLPTTQAGYNDLAEKDPDTLYVITDGVPTMLADASNATQAGRELIGGMSLPSNRTIDLELGADQTSYTAPANGYYIIWGNFGNVNGYFAFVNNANGFSAQSKATSGDYSCSCTIQVKKGDVVYVGYNYNPLSSTASGQPRFKFVYQEGSK